MQHNTTGDISAFHLHYIEMPITYREEIGTGSIPYLSLKAHPQFHHSWQNIPTRGGIEDVPFVTHRGFSIHRLGASPLVGELPRPYFFSIRDSAICL